VSGGGAGKESPVSMRLPVPFYEDGLKITTEDETDGSRIVALPHRTNGSMNGHAAYAGGK
jgi:hypothetical protein